MGESTSATDVRSVVQPYVGPDTRRAVLQLASTLGPLALTMWAAHALLQWSVWPALLLVPLIAGLLVRTFILMHDCAHGSLFASRRANEIVGFVTGALTLTAFDKWRRDHALHHASSGDLDRRGHGDVPTLTVREYLALSPGARLRYRIVRHPLLLLLGGPFYLVVGQRWSSRNGGAAAKQFWSVALTNIAILVGLGLGAWFAGWTTVMVAYLLPFYLAAIAGVWLFYVQHQFEDAYWAPHEDWSYVDAAIRGSSRLQLPAILNWFTGDIGMHHVHHVAPRIPNYRLRQCHEENALFHAAPTVTLASGMAALRLALWDEDEQRLVAIRDVRVEQAQPSPPALAG